MDEIYIQNNKILRDIKIIKDEIEMLPDKLISKHNERKILGEANEYQIIINKYNEKNNRLRRKNKKRAIQCLENIRSARQELITFSFVLFNIPSVSLAVSLELQLMKMLKYSKKNIRLELDKSLNYFDNILNDKINGASKKLEKHRIELSKTKTNFRSSYSDSVRSSPRGSALIRIPLKFQYQIKLLKSKEVEKLISLGILNKDERPLNYIESYVYGYRQSRWSAKGQNFDVAVEKSRADSDKIHLSQDNLYYTAAMIHLGNKTLKHLKQNILY